MPQIAHPLPEFVVLFALCATGFIAAGANERGGCAPTDYAPESLTLRAGPDSRSTVVASLSRDKATSMVRLDAVASAHGDWIKVNAGAAVGWLRARNVECRSSPEEARAAVAAEASQVIEALKAGNFAELTPYVHPIKGVRFSPHATVDPGTDIIIQATQLGPAFRSPVKRVWGADDGSGAPIRLTFAGYYRKFVYSRDFSRAPQILYNTPDDGAKKAWEAYPGAIIVEYRFPESGTTSAEALRLVFEQHQQKWYLSGIIHDGWTI